MGTVIIFITISVFASDIVSLHVGPFPKPWGGCPYLPEMNNLICLRSACMFSLLFCALKGPTSGSHLKANTGMVPRYELPPAPHTVAEAPLMLENSQLLQFSLVTPLCPGPKSYC